jgi:hypothetical protein
MQNDVLLVGEAANRYVTLKWIEFIAGAGLILLLIGVLVFGYFRRDEIKKWLDG